MGTINKPTAGLVVLSAAALILGACGAGDAVSTTSTAPVTEPSPGSTSMPPTTVQSTTTTSSVTTAPETTTTSEVTTSEVTTTVPATTSTTIRAGATVEDVVAWMEAWLADRFEGSDPPEGITGPPLVVCEDSGPVDVGEVLACRLEPETEPGFELDEGGVVIYVLDPSGGAVWEAGTDVPDSTRGLEELHAAATHGLMCRDLMSEDYADETYHFSGVGRPEESAFFWSLVYWSLEGEPDRMDADGNGIPCETLHPSDMVSAVLEGGPVPLYLR